MTYKWLNNCLLLTRVSFYTKHIMCVNVQFDWMAYARNDGFTGKCAYEIREKHD